MRLICFADLHIKLFKRHEEYREVFERLYTSLKEKKPDRIIILGDIFHSKSILSPEAIQLCFEFLKNLSSIEQTRGSFAHIDVIVGNHDCSLQNNTRLNSLKPIIFELNDSISDRAYINLYEKSGLIQIEWNDDGSVKTQYGIFSLLDEQHFPILQQKILNSLTIALFHGNLIGSITETGYRFNSGNYDPEIMFKNYDTVLCGDIHKRQKIKCNNNVQIFYPGSIISQNFSECEEKGYLFFDTDKSLEPEFIPIHNNYKFYNIKTKDKITLNNIPVINKCASKPSIRLTLEDHDYTIAEKKSIEIELDIRYKPVFLEVKQEQKKQIIQNQSYRVKLISDLNVQNELIQKFLNKKYTFKQIQRVIKINEKIRNQIDSDGVLQPITWKLKEFRWDNTFSYGQDNIINFEKLKGITGVFAKNRAGKSSIIRSLLYNLFNKSDVTSKVTNIINEQLEECNSSSIFSIGNEEYRITRKSKRKEKGTTTKVLFEKNVATYWCNENLDNKVDTDDLIKKYIGNFEDVIITSISPQDKISNFLDSGYDGAFRLNLLSRFLGLNIFKQQYDLASKEIDEFETLLKQFENIDYAEYISKYKEELEKLLESMTDLDEDKIYLNNSNNIIKSQIVILKSMIKDIKDSGEAIKYDDNKLEELLKKLQDQKKTEIQLSNIEKIKLQKLYNTNYEEQKNIAKKNIEIKKQLEKELNSVDSDIRVVNSEFKKDRSKIDILDKQEFHKETEICKICEFYIDAISQKEQLKNVEQKISNLSKKRINIVNQIVLIFNPEKELEFAVSSLNKIENLEFQEKNIKLNIEKLDLQIDKVRNALQECEKESNKIESIKQIIETNDEIYLFLVKKELEQKNLEKMLSNVEYSLTQHNRRIVELENNISLAENNIKKMNELELQYSDYKIYLQCIHREGIPYSIISSYIDIINDEISKIIGDYISFSIKFSLDEEKKSVPINMVHENGSIIPIELGSGMEKMISAIAIRAALLEISNIPKANFLIIDESFGKLDQDNIAELDSFLQHLKTMFDHIILISHVKDICDYCDQIITIDKVNGFSKLVYN